MSQANDDGVAVHKLQHSPYTHRRYILQVQTLLWHPMRSADKAVALTARQATQQVC